MSRWTRRALLRGLGAGLALPWLESLSGRLGPWGPGTAWASAGAGAGGAPLRFVVWMVPNGMPMDAWTPEGEGTDWTASPILTPLEQHRDRLVVVSGLRSEGEPGYEPHMNRSTSWLTGVSTPPWDRPAGQPFVSLDQHLASHLGAGLVRPSLELSSEGPAFCSEAASGQIPSCSPYSTVSWADGSTPLPRQVSPRAAFGSLFGTAGVSTEDAARAARLDQAVFDVAQRDASRLRTRLGSGDRHRLDQYLDGVSALRDRIEALETATLDGACADPANDLLASGRLDLTGDVASHVAAMNEVMALALQCDRTRVISYMLGNCRSNRPYPDLGLSSSHHELSHHGGNTTKLDAIETIGVWEVEAFAQFLDLLEAIPEGDGTVLDHTVVLFGSPVADPDTHGDRPLPTVLAAGSGVDWTLGRHLVMPELTPMTRLHASVAQALGVPLAGSPFEGATPLPL